MMRELLTHANLQTCTISGYGLGSNAPVVLFMLPFDDPTRNKNNLYDVEDNKKDADILV